MIPFRVFRVFRGLKIMSQLSFLLESKAPSQADIILGELEAHRGQWVSMDSLWQLSRAHAVHSRIADLRKRGHFIDNRREKQADGMQHSFYRLN